MEITTSWHKKGRQEGRLEGRKKGEIDLICKFLQTRFGDKSLRLQEHVKKIDGQRPHTRYFSDELGRLVFCLAFYICH